MISAEPQPVEVLKFPHPYRAAFTVSSDIDSGSLVRFRAIHALFSGREIIKKDSPEWEALGLKVTSPRFDKERGGVCGLGLGFSDSFFLIGDQTTFGMYRYFPEEARFKEDVEEGENCAVVMRQWLRLGQLEAFHAFLHYTRQQVEPLLKDLYNWCENENVAKPKVWINHSAAVTPSGICPDQLQPSRAYRLFRYSARYLVGPLLGRKRQPLRYAFVRYWGDTPGSRYYINDLLSANGIRFVWLNMDDSHRDQIALPEQIQNGRSTILQSVTMDDGVRYWRFERCYGGPPGRTSGQVYLRDSKDGYDSSCLINENNLSELYRKEGTCILHTHWTHFRSMPLSDETISRFDLLRNWNAAGKIWVTSSARLLEWTRLRTFLKLDIHREGRRLIVNIEGVNDPIFGFEPVSLANLEGLSFKLKDSQDSITVALKGQPLESHQVTRAGDLVWINGRDAKGDCATIRDKADGTTKS